MTVTPLDRFRMDIDDRVAKYEDDQPLQDASRRFFEEIGIGRANYVYNFFWLGVPIIQIPQDLQAMQEMIWEVKPDLIIETGIAWGGTLIHSASMLAILEACREIEDGRVIGIDIDIRAHNKAALAAHPLSRKITMLEGSSTDPEIVSQVRKLASSAQRVMLFLDSNHTHEHVLGELRAYGPMVSVGSYCMVGDTVIEDAPESMNSHRPWGAGNSPKSAVYEFLEILERGELSAADGGTLRFEIDKLLERKVLVTGSPDGYLKRVE